MGNDTEELLECMLASEKLYEAQFFIYAVCGQLCSAAPRSRRQGVLGVAATVAADSAAGHREQSVVNETVFLTNTGVLVDC